MNSANSLLFMLGSFMVAINGVTMYQIDDFFPQINGNLSQITWAHAVNSKSLLEKVLKDDTIMMIEADVSIGTVTNGDGSSIPIMAHPPATTSDLSMEEFLKSIDEFNKNQQNNETRKGIKLDFKDTGVFQNAHTMIRELYEKMKCPIWLNADIIKGPLDATTEPVSEDVFLANAKIYTRAVLSLGWTTNYGGNIKNASYTDEQIQNMINAIKVLDGNLEVTFAVRAGIAAKSRAQMKTLRDSVVNCTLTVWSSEGDDVVVEELRNVIFDFGVNRVYIDVPKDLLDQLDLGGKSDGGGAGNVQPSVVVMLGLLICAMALIKSLY